MTNLSSFQIGFWHPFGAHSNESPEEILKRKEREIRANNGWTLWSFQYRAPKFLAVWQQELLLANQARVFALCSASNGRDPKELNPELEVIHCRHYTLLGEETRSSIPDRIVVPHTFRANRSKYPTAFIVSNVFRPSQPCVLSGVEWLRRDGWQKDGIPIYDNGLPSHGEILIRRGGAARTRPVRAILELKAPYLAVVQP